jgi:hypothetical protein
VLVQISNLAPFRHLARKVWWGFGWLQNSYSKLNESFFLYGLIEKKKLYLSRLRSASESVCFSQTFGVLQFKTVYTSITLFLIVLRSLLYLSTTKGEKVDPREPFGSQRREKLHSFGSFQILGSKRIQRNQTIRGSTFSPLSTTSGISYFNTVG